MSIILLLSIALRLAATAYSLVIVTRFKDWRLGFLPLMFSLMTLRQIFTLAAQSTSWTTITLSHWTEIPGLMVSALCLFAVTYLDRFLADREHMESQLRESEHRYRTVVKSAPICIYEFDPNMTLLSMNPAGLRMLDLQDEKDILGCAFPKLLPQEEYQRLRPTLDRAQQGHSVQFDFHLIVRGQSKVFRQLLTPVVRIDGTVCKLVGLTLDLTHERTAAEALQRSEARLREAQRVAQIGSWDLDIPTNALTWSDEVYRIFEIDPNGFGASYDAFLQLVHPDDREFVNQVFTDSLKNRQPYNIVHRLLMPDGRMKFVHERCETIYDGQGNALRSIGTVQDITTQQETANELRQTLQHLHELTRQLERVREEERKSLARELHDEFGHTLTGLKFDLKKIQRHLSEGAIEHISPRIHSMLQTLDALFQTIRRVAGNLRPTLLDDLGLLAALDWQCQQVQRQTGITCYVECRNAQPLTRLTPDQATSLYRVAQEFLTNTVRHAQASSVMVKVWEQDDTLNLEIQDDGTGITHEDLLKSTSYGIRSMRERISLINGEFFITGHPEKGTQVRIKLPISPQGIKTSQ